LLQFGGLQLEFLLCLLDGVFGVVLEAFLHRFHRLDHLRRQSRGVGGLLLAGFPLLEQGGQGTLAARAQVGQHAVDGGILTAALDRLGRLGDLQSK
jgi:hypothetical protein